jgi:hypothetical protein
MIKLALVIAVSLVPRAVQAQDPADAKHATMVAAIAKLACVPPPKIVVDKKQQIENVYKLTLHADGTKPVICAARDGLANDAPFACFTVDPATGALASRPTQLFPGSAYLVPSGCAHGFCRPKETVKPDASSEVLGFSNDGTRVARTGDKLEIYDAKSKTLQRTIELEGGLQPTDLIFHGDLVFVAAMAAGPDGGVWMYSAGKGKLLGAVGPPPTADGASYVNISNGSYRIVDGKTLVVSDGGYEEATVDLATTKITMRSLPKPAACTDEAWQAVQSFDQIGEVDGKPPAKCLKAVRAEQKKFWKAAPAKPNADFTLVGDASYKLRHDKAPTLQVLDANAKKPRTVKLAVCK